MKSTLLLGKNYYSFLISFALFERNKKVVLVEEHSKAFDDKKFIFDFERAVINTWGLDCEISQLLDLDIYLTPAPYRLIFDQKHLNLGARPGQNYNEILRKFPSFFSLDPIKDTASHEKFDLMFKTFSEKFGVRLFRFLNPENLDLELMWEILPEELKKIFLDFKVQSKKGNLKFIICFLQGFFQHRLSDEISDFDLLFILLFLLSPRYEINRKKFEEDLFKHFKKKGGEVISMENPSFQIKGSQLNQFSIEDRPPLNIEKVFLTSGEFFSVPLNCDSKSAYTSLKVKLNLKISDLINEEFVISRTDRLGSNHPFTRVKFEKDGIIGEVLIPFMDGSKESFEEKAVLGILLNDLKEILGYNLEGDLNPSLRYSQKFWILDRENKSTVNWSFFQRPVKNLFIYHEPSPSSLGGLSTLAKIKDERGHII